MTSGVVFYFAFQSLVWQSPIKLFDWKEKNKYFTATNRSLYAASEKPQTKRWHEWQKPVILTVVESKQWQVGWKLNDLWMEVQFHSIKFSLRDMCIIPVFRDKT